MKIFKLEEYLAKYEFTAPYLLCCSDAESFSMQEVLDLANSEEKLLWQNLALGYTEPQGLPLLRNQIVKGLYPAMEPHNILCFAGAEDGIFCTLHTLCEKGNHVIVFSPCYQSLIEIPVEKGCEVSEIVLREDNEWKIDLSEVKAALRNNTKGIVINFPHNPSGQVISQQELVALVDLCKEHDLWLFSDEVYRLLGQPEVGWSSPAAEIYDKAISLGVMSKAFGMAGLRIGWVACKDTNLLKKIEFTKHYTSICNSAPSEILSLISLRNKDVILARNNKIVAGNLKLLDDFMKKYDNLFSWVRPQGGCVGFINYKGKESVDDFSNRLVNDKGVLLMPASIYNHNSKHFRIGFGRKNMEAALNGLIEFISS
jgi:aspartate/methionine/tyrosine aminotransferase